MAYEALQLPDLTKVNELFNPDLNAIRHGQALASQITPNILQEQLRGAKLANDMTEQLQPQQLQLLSGLTGLGGLGISSAAPPPGDPPPSGALAGGRSLLSGDTPTSADQAAQQRVAQVAQANGVNPEWAMRVQHAESGPFPNSMAVVSPAGALGTMQLMPDTAKGLGVDPSDPEQNVTGGVKYLAQLKQQYGDPVIATAAYNAGPGKVDAWLAGKAALPSETVNYVGKVFGGNGVDLLHNVFAGAHGHPVAGVQVADASGQIGGDQVPIGPGQSPIQGAALQGLAPMPMDDRARASVRQLAMMRALAVAKGDYRGAAAFTSQLDNIAGPGGVVSPSDGNVYQVPGSFQTRFNAARAAEAGKVGPAVDLHAQQANIDRQTHAVNVGTDTQAHQVNAATDTQEQLLRPMQVAPSHAVIIPGRQPALGPQAQTDPGALQNVPGGAAPPQAGVYQPPPDSAQKAAEAEAERATKAQDEVLSQAKESQNAINRIAQARTAMHAATANGVPPGKFAGPLAEASAAAKSLGIDLSSLGIKPEAIQNQQVANEALTQINGEILKRMFPQRITNADVATFGRSLANYGMDPAALEPILNMAEQAAQYDTSKANHMLAYKKQKGSVVGWDSEFYPQHGYGPQLFDALRSGTVPGGGSAAAPTAQSSSATPAQVHYTRDSPATPMSRPDVEALPSGTFFRNPADGRILVKH